MTAPRHTTIRASEIGTYLYCRRAWWYQRRGEESTNQVELRAGTRLHSAHGRAVFTAGLYRWVGYALLLAALALAAGYLVNTLL